MPFAGAFGSESVCDAVVPSSSDASFAFAVAVEVWVATVSPPVAGVENAHAEPVQLR